MRRGLKQRDGNLSFLSACRLRLLCEPAPPAGQLSAWREGYPAGVRVGHRPAGQGSAAGGRHSERRELQEETLRLLLQVHLFHYTRWFCRCLRQGGHVSPSVSLVVGNTGGFTWILFCFLILNSMKFWRQSKSGSGSSLITLEILILDTPRY